MYIIVHHIPKNFVAPGDPSVLPAGFVAFDSNRRTDGSEIAVPIPCCHLENFVFLEASRCILHYCKSYRQYVVKLFFKFLKDLFVDLIYLIIEFFFPAVSYTHLTLPTN